MLPQKSLYRVFVKADFDSTVLSRIGDILATLSLIPECFRAGRGDTGADEALLAVMLVAATPRQADLLIRKLLQLTLVHGVESRLTTGGPESGLVTKGCRSSG